MFKKKTNGYVIKLSPQGPKMRFKSEKEAQEYLAKLKEKNNKYRKEKQFSMVSAEPAACSFCNHKNACHRCSHLWQAFFMQSYFILILIFYYDAANWLLYSCA